MTKRTVVECRYGLTVAGTKASGNKIKPMAMVGWCTPKATSLRVNGVMTKLMGKVRILK